MNQKKTTLYIGREHPLFNQYSIRVAVEANGEIHAGLPLAVTAIDPGEHVEPVMTVDHDTVQHMMDELWGLGFRPSAGVSSTGQIEAMQAHLDDMRKLVFVGVERDVMRTAAARDARVKAGEPRS
ncbi:MAG: hypothetical protein MJA28_06375 [Gammaproteobacteria bacterium]|nr:hypothetical protein [Gammaproteobacteria bacterium]